MIRRRRIREILQEGIADEQLSCVGWVRSLRVGKGVAFIALNDGSCLASLQVVLTPEVPEFEEACRIATGSALRVTGQLAASPAAGQRVELTATALEVVGPAD